MQASQMRICTNHFCFLFSVYFLSHPHPSPMYPLETPPLWKVTGEPFVSKRGKPCVWAGARGIFRAPSSVFSEPDTVEWMVIQRLLENVKTPGLWETPGGWGWLQVSVKKVVHSLPPTPTPTPECFWGVLWAVWVAGCRVFSKSALRAEIWLCHCHHWSCWLRNHTKQF